MHVTGIIAEYNPFHTGHLHQLQTVKAKNGGAVVVALSGWAVQRGELPLFTPGTRAKAALLNGADLVVEVPAPYAMQSAEGFAAAGVAVLAALGVVNTLAFGTEGTLTGEELYAAARHMETERTGAILKASLARGLSYPAAKAVALSAVPGGLRLGTTPNNILALEYACACLVQKTGLELLPLPRQGVGHSAAAPAGGFAPASFLRKAVASGNLAYLSRFVPLVLLPFYQTLFESGAYFTKNAAFSAALLARLRTMPAEELQKAPGISEGLEHAIKTAAATATSAEMLLQKAKSKRYPYARLARCTTAALLGYKKGLPPLPFVHVLGANETGFHLLHQAKKAAKLPVSHSLAQLAATGAAAGAVAAQSAAAADIFTLFSRTPGPAGLAYTEEFSVI